MLLKESVITKQTYQKDNLPEGILARVTYPIMVFDSVNANKRKYSKKVAENVLKDANIQDKLKTRTLFGDSEHPEYVQVKLSPTTTANIISDLYIDEATGTLNAVVDILPTIAGKFIYTLYEAGCDVGVSTRAEGDLSEELDEATKEKVFSVVPESYRLSCLDHTGDPSTQGARPIEFVKSVKDNYESKKFSKEDTLCLLESIHIPEAMSLMESIKAESKPLVETKVVAKESQLKIGAIVVLKEGYRGILNHMFAKTGKAIVQVGLERKVVNISECTLLEDYGSGDGSGLLASKKKEDTKLEDKPKEKLLDDKVEESKSLMEELRDEDISSQGTEESEKMGAIDQPSADNEIPGMDTNDEAPSNEMSAEGGQTEGISSFEFVEDIYDSAVALNPELANYPQEEVIKGFQNEIGEHNEDILEDSIQKLADLVCDHLAELPNYYTVVETAIIDAQSQEGDNNAPKDENGEVAPTGEVSGENLEISANNKDDSTREVAEGIEDGKENEVEGGEGVAQNTGDKAQVDPNHVDEPVKGSISKPGLYIVRHASTSYNSKDKTKDLVRGWTDIPLDEKGKEQAGALAEEFKAVQINKIITSDLGRAVETGSIIAQANNVQDVTSIEGFRPWNMGDFQGKSSAEAIPELEDYVRNKPDEEVPNGESFNSFAKRAIDSLKQVIEESKNNTGSTTIVVTHYRDIKLFQAWVQGGSKDDYSVDANTFVSDDVEPGTTFYLNTETEGILNLDKVFELEAEGEEQKADNSFESKKDGEIKLKIKAKVKLPIDGSAIKIKSGEATEDKGEEEVKESLADDRRRKKCADCGLIARSKSNDKGLCALCYKNLHDKEKEEVLDKQVESKVPIITEYIHKINGKYVIKSHRGKTLGTYATEGGAKKRLGEIEYFKKKNESKINEDENIGDHLNLHANKMYKKHYKDLSAEEKKTVDLKSRAGNFPAKESKDDKLEDETSGDPSEKLDKIKLKMKLKVKEALAKAENEAILEQAEGIIRSIQENYIKDIMASNGLSESLKKSQAENTALKNIVEANNGKIQGLSVRIEEAKAELSQSQKALEEAKILVDTKVGEVTNLQKTLVEAKRSYEDSIINEKIKSVARVTGLSLGESEVKSLRECKDDKSFFKKLEGIRETMSQRILHTNILSEIKIAETIPVKPVVVGGINLGSNILDRVTSTLKSMS